MTKTSIAAHAATRVAAWGNTNWWTETPPPPNLTNVIAIGASNFRDLALNADGTVVAWGLNQAEVPRNLSNFVAISSESDGHNLALKSDGTVVAWGDNFYGQTNVPPGLTNAVAISAGVSHNLALRADGKVVAWGLNDFGDTAVPVDLSHVVAIAAGHYHNLALKADGTVVAWGGNQFDEQEIPAGLSNVVGIAAGSGASLALKADGTVVGWGCYSLPLGGCEHVPVPGGLSNVVAIAIDRSHSLALKGDGTVVGWGTRRAILDNHLTKAPAGLTNVVAIAAGGDHNLALVGDGQPLLTTPLVNRTAAYGQTVHLRMTATGAWPLRYQWKFNGAQLPNATNGLLALSAVKYDQAGAYSVVVTDRLGQTTGAEMLLEVVPLLLTDPPQDRITFLGGTAEFRAAADGEGALAYQWEFNGRDLPGATNATLVLTNSQFNQSGSYRLIVSNRLGTVRSTEAKLSVTPVAVLGGNVNFTSQKNVPVNLTNVLAVSGGNAHTLALMKDGTVAAWGFNGSGQIDVPNDLANQVAVSAGGFHSLALGADGIVRAWGHNGLGEQSVPRNLTNVVAIAGGGSHSLALKANGNVVAWGAGTRDFGDRDYEIGQLIVPAGLSKVVAIAAGYNDSMALKADGTVVTWGLNDRGQADVPPTLRNVAAVAAGDFHNLALIAEGPPLSQVQLTNLRRDASGFNVSLATQSGKVYRLEYKDSLADSNWTALPLVAGSGRVLALTDPTATESRRFYRVRRW